MQYKVNTDDVICSCWAKLSWLHIILGFIRVSQQSKRQTISSKTKQSGTINQPIWGGASVTIKYFKNNKWSHHYKEGRICSVGRWSLSHQILNVHCVHPWLTPSASTLEILQACTRKKRWFPSFHVVARHTVLTFVVWKKKININSFIWFISSLSYVYVICINTSNTKTFSYIHIPHTAHTVYAYNYMCEYLCIVLIFLNLILF